MTLPTARPLRYADYSWVQALPQGPWPIRRGGVPLLPEVDRLASASFAPRSLHPGTRAFFVEPPARLTVPEVAWERWALPIAPVYASLARYLDNLCVPEHLDGPVRMSSAIHELDLGDGLPSRRWERRFPGTGARFYVAAVRPHTDGDCTWLSVQFPMGRVQLLVVLGLRTTEDGLVLDNRWGQRAGTWTLVPGRRRFVALPGPPTRERLTWSETGAGLHVLHEAFALGHRAFRVRYRVAS